MGIFFRSEHFMDSFLPITFAFKLSFLVVQSSRYAPKEFFYMLGYLR